MFYSKFINRLDGKGRVSMPATWRHEVAKGGEKTILLRPDLNGQMLEGMEHSRVRKIAESLDNESQYPTDTPLRTDLAKIAISQFQPLDFDINGRILLPEELIAHASLKDKVLFAGVGMTLQLWQPSRYSDWMTRTLKEGKEQNIDIHLKPHERGG